MAGKWLQLCCCWVGGVKSLPKNIPTIRLGTPTIIWFPNKKLLNKLLPSKLLIERIAYRVWDFRKSKFGVPADSFCGKQYNLRFMGGNTKSKNSGERGRLTLSQGCRLLAFRQQVVSLYQEVSNSELRRNFCAHFAMGRGTSGVRHCSKQTLNSHKACSKLPVLSPVLLCLSGRACWKLWLCTSSI